MLKQINAWDLLDPNKHQDLRKFLQLTKSIDNVHNFGDEELWTRFQTVAEGLGIPLSAVLDAYHQEGSL